MDDAQQIHRIARVAADLPIPGDGGLGAAGQIARGFPSSPPLSGLPVTHGLPPSRTVSSNGVQSFFWGIVSNELREQRVAILLTLDGPPSGRQLSRSYLIGFAFWVASKSHIDSELIRPRGRYAMTPASLKLKYSLHPGAGAPIMMWSSNCSWRILLASRILLVRRMSASEGEGSPDGWLCTMTNA